MRGESAGVESYTMRRAHALFVFCSVIGLALMAISPPAAAHPGGLDASGCHMNRKTSDYHCHQAATSPTLQPTGSLPLVGREGSLIIKKSRSGICHAPNSRYYAQTLHFVTYNSLEACIASGGRPPR
jgi:hypothetical protein